VSTYLVAWQHFALCIIGGCPNSIDLLHKSKIKTPPRQSYALSPLPLARGGVGGGVLGIFATDLINDTPNSMNDTPNSINDIPNSINDIPNSINDIPNSINDIPNSINDTPNSINDIPNSINDTPNSINDTPNSMNDTPNSIREFQVKKYSIAIVDC
jgi:uncharacterized protein YoxC